MSQTSGAADSTARDQFPGHDPLPPVEAPNAGFILQLFIIPGMIVITIFAIVGMLRWLAQAPTDPRAYVAALAKNNEGRWRAAVNLANALREPGNAQIKRDADLADELVKILDAELANDSRDQLEQSPVTLRIFLSRALGEFYVDRGVPVLIKAATTRRSDSELDVQLSAVEALAVLTSNLREAAAGTVNEPEAAPADIGHPEIAATMVELSRDENERLRSAAAYGLGVIGGQRAIARLETMIDDEVYPDARYNAATALARYGNAKSVGVLVEMLDPAETSSVELEKADPAKKHSTIIRSGLRSASKLADTNPKADLAPLVAAVEQLLKHGVDRGIAVEATPVLEKLRRHAAASQPQTQP